MTLETIIPKIEKKMIYATGFNHMVLFDLGDDGFIHIDGTQSPPELSTEEKDAEVTLETTATVLNNILDGTQDPNVAFLMRKLKIRGNLKLAMKLNAFLES
ncbi:MAG: SCP2 sterol-binding domain-containing protein [Pseudobdellovibrionaceae bacterium]|jgi:putative sterol carrier protein|nr:SCP2 sterol-binding domain-containing protein [Pseudobdellovibrionaceae bacterium]